MINIRRTAVLADLLCLLAAAQAGPPLDSVYSSQDPALRGDLASPVWNSVSGVIADRDNFGRLVPGHRTEIRSRWTKDNLYLLFICPYQKLWLKPNPHTQQETYALWDWDVAEAFLGSDFNNIRRYREFEVSPRGEWLDVDVDLAKPHPVDGWKWNSGFEVKTRINHEKHVWYAEMRIPWKALQTHAPLPGDELRANFYREQGPPTERLSIAWQPTHKESFHAPEVFGRLRLVQSAR